MKVLRIGLAVFTVLVGAYVCLTQLHFTPVTTDTQEADNIHFANESAAAIKMIRINSAYGETGGCYADGSLIQTGDVFGFHLRAGANTFTVRAEDETGDTIAQTAFTKTVTYNADGQIWLYIRDGADGSIYITDKE